MAASMLLLFGPVSPRPSQAYLSQLRTFITERRDHELLVELIQELPRLWPTILQACPQLHSVRGAEQLDQLNHFLASGILPNADALSNLVAAPLTVISHISEVLSQGQGLGKLTIPALDSVQGFCIGFLTATAVATSRDTIEFRQYASVAVRLALCIGAVIELDEASFNDSSERSTSIAVRWKSFSGKHDLEMMLKQCPTVSLQENRMPLTPRYLEPLTLCVSKPRENVIREARFLSFPMVLPSLLFYSPLLSSLTSDH